MLLIKQHECSLFFKQVGSTAYEASSRSQHTFTASRASSGKPPSSSTLTLTSDSAATIDAAAALTDDVRLNSVYSTVHNSNDKEAQCEYLVPLMKNFINVEICGKSAHVLIDTGADVCVADERVIDKYNLKNFCSFMQSDKSNLNTADNTSMSVTQMAVVPFKIGDCKTNAKFYFVKKLHVDFICGLDWLNSNDACVDFSLKSLRLNKRKLLFSTHNVTVPPYSEQIFIARIRGNDMPRGVTGVTCALQTSQLLVGKMLDTVEQNTVRVRCLNVTEKPVEIKRNENVAQFKCLTSGDKLYPLQVHSGVEDKCSDQPNDKNFKPSDQISIASNSDITDSDKRRLCELVDNYSDVFVGADGILGKCDLIKHKIDLIDKTPVRRRAYRLNPKQQIIMENKINELLKQGIIEESTSPWSSPCMLIQKKNGEHRLVTDLRGVNAKTAIMANPLPTTCEALETIGMAKPKWFSTMDLQSGFFQAELDPESRPYTAFSTHMGLFQYTKLPQGMANSAQTFQRLMQAVLRGLNWHSCAVYIDDIIVYEGQTFDEHLQAIEKVFVRLQRANLKLRPGKCQFAKRKIKFLGHIISADGIEPDPEKIEAVKSYPTPTDVKSLRSFMGLVNYYRSFCKGLSHTAAALNALLKKNMTWKWTADCQAAFDTLKQTLVTAPMLRYPDLSKPFTLYTDASNFSVGACLTQEYEGKEHVVAYAGRALSSAECNMAITHKEGVALKYGVQHFDFYLRNTPFTAVVDHQALLALLNQKEPTGKFARWVALFQMYPMTLVYRQGSKHGNADALSRRVYTSKSDDTLATDTVLAIDDVDQATHDARFLARYA
jgi:predicted aspartyl protease